MNRSAISTATSLLMRRTCVCALLLPPAPPISTATSLLMRRTSRRATTALLSRLAIVLLCALALGLNGCSRVPLPKVSMPKMPSMPSLGKDDKPAPAVDRSATPRDLLGAQLINPRANEATPNMTVGKMIEFADRYLACDCAGTRFVRTWEKTSEGYKAFTHSDAIRPLEFMCKDGDDARQCYLRELDRGSQSATLEERFTSGSNFIQFLYEHGVKCERETPCQ
jgi:hypothetical protein